MNKVEKNWLIIKPKNNGHKQGKNGVKHKMYRNKIAILKVLNQPYFIRETKA